MSYDQSRFLKAADLEREKKFRIKSVTEELIGAQQKEKKLVVWFTNDGFGFELSVKVTAARATTWVKTGDVLGPKVPSPEYEAVSEWLPAFKVEIVSVATR